MQKPTNLQDLVAQIAALLQLPATNNPIDLVALLERAVATLLQQLRDDEVITREQFCEEQDFKASYWFKLKRDKRIPRMITNRTMRRSAVREWQARMEEESLNGPPRLAYKRRQVQCRKAALIGVVSPDHPHPRGSGGKGCKKRVAR